MFHLHPFWESHFAAFRSAKFVFFSEIAPLVRPKSKKTDKRAYADNPTDKAVSFSIDGTQYEIPAGGHIRIDLKAGEHSMSIPNQSEPVKFTVQEYSEAPLINPTGSVYATISVAFTDKEMTENVLYMQQFKKVNVAGQYYYGPFEVYSDYFVDRYQDSPWRFGLDEEIPDEISTREVKGSTSYNFILDKLYRLADFHQATLDIFGEDLRITDEASEE